MNQNRGDSKNTVNASTILNEDLNNIVKTIDVIAKVLEGKSVLISGGAGFIGSYITAVFQLLNREYLKKPCKVFVVDNYITGSRGNLIEDIEDENISFIERDVRAPIEIQGELDYILHAAGIASPIYYRRFPVEAIETAVWGAKNLLTLARTKEVMSFLFFSSSEIYGDPSPDFIPTPETYRGNVSCTGPRACYDESKRLGESLCVTFNEHYGVPIKIVRPFNVYGPGMKPNDYRVIPTFLMQGLESESLKVHATGTQTRTFCYATDAVAAFFKVLLSDKNGEIYNVGNDQEEISMLALAEMIAELFDDHLEVELIDYPDSYPKDEPQRRLPDLTKIRRELNYQPQVDLRTGIERALVWFKQVTAPSI